VQDRARHGCLLCQTFQRPLFPRPLVEQGQGAAHAGVPHPRKPAGLARGQIVHVAAQNLHEHHLAHTLQQRLAAGPPTVGLLLRSVQQVSDPAVTARGKSVHAQHPRQRSQKRVERARVARQEAADDRGLPPAAAVQPGRGDALIADVDDEGELGRPRCEIDAHVFRAASEARLARDDVSVSQDRPAEPHSAKQV
jgi:hypothetical protein